VVRKETGLPPTPEERAAARRQTEMMQAAPWPALIVTCSAMLGAGADLCRPGS